jgi:hypothetical protein
MTSHAPLNSFPSLIRADIVPRSFVRKSTEAYLSRIQHVLAFRSISSNAHVLSSRFAAHEMTNHST